MEMKSFQFSEKLSHSPGISGGSYRSEEAALAYSQSCTLYIHLNFFFTSFMLSSSSSSGLDLPAPVGNPLVPGGQ